MYVYICMYVYKHRTLITLITLTQVGMWSTVFELYLDDEESALFTLDNTQIAVAFDVLVTLRALRALRSI